MTKTMISLMKAAERLGICVGSAKSLAQKGVLPATQMLPGSPWLVPVEALPLRRFKYFYTMLAATLVAPGHNRVVPLEPEFVVPQDGHDKQDCESRAARRWLAAHGKRYARFKPIYLGDDLFSRQPICPAVLESGGHFLFVCKPDSHKAMEDQDSRTNRLSRWRVVEFPGERAFLAQSGISMAFLSDTAARQASPGWGLCNHRESGVR
jgi:hypothetical protein